MIMTGKFLTARTMADSRCRAAFAVTAPTGGLQPWSRTELKQVQAMSLTGHVGWDVMIRLCGQEPAVDRYDCAMDIASKVTGQDQSHASDFIRLARATDWQSPRKISPGQQ